MKVLLTGATGYIGKRLLPVLVDKGHEVICCVRDVDRFHPPKSLKEKISVIQVDFLDEDTLKNIPQDIDGAFYLIHSMSASRNYKELEQRSAYNFRESLRGTKIQHVIYLSGIANDPELSEHLSSRKMVETELRKGDYHFTTLRAGIIIGSGSASFEIIRDLVEKLPVMITPKWLLTRCQPIAIADVIDLLNASLFNPDTYDQNFDIGGPDIMSYKDMLLGLARIRNLKRRIFIVPVMTPRLSSYWLYFVTSTSYKLAIALVDSMKVEVVCSDTRINDVLGIQPMSYEMGLKRAFKKIESNSVVSSWIDAHVSSGININISDFIQVPTHGCYLDRRDRPIINRDQTIERIWNIGGKNGWYYANFLWKIRGYLDKFVGGVGLRRGRTSESNIQPGDALDFWRVLYADREEGRLLLFAEMKLPGDAWLEFKIENNTLIQTATFRPLGLNGRIYWYSILPFHGLIFNGMLKALTK